MKSLIIGLNKKKLTKNLSKTMSAIESQLNNCWKKFPRNLPEELEIYINKKYFSSFVFPSLIKNHNSVWNDDPSDRIIELCKDTGTIQQGHHELEELIEDHNMWAWEICTSVHCLNCKFHKFPCKNLSVFGFNNEKLWGLWEPNFVKKKIRV